MRLKGLSLLSIVVNTALFSVKTNGIILALVHLLDSRKVHVLLDSRKVHVADATRKVITETSCTK